MSKEHPTPWTFHAVDAFEDTPIRAANGEHVLVRDNGACPPDLETCREIVEAVNWYCDWGAMSAELERLRDERDRLRDLVRRLASVAHDTLNFAEAMCGIIPDNPERAKARSEIEALLREARTAIGEDKP